jgi:hypothetical protein
VTVTGLGGWGYQGFCNYSTKALVLKSVMKGKGVPENSKYSVTSFMDVPVPFYLIFLPFLFSRLPIHAKEEASGCGLQESRVLRHELGSGIPPQVVRG